MNGVELLIAISLGVGLAAASGFRIFIPPFLYGAAARLDYLPSAIPTSGLQDWMASDIGLVVGLATIIEIIAYYVPWMDNLLDTIASPAAMLSGVLLMSSSLGDSDPLLRWGLSIIAGGSVSGVVQGSDTVALRAVSTATTGARQSSRINSRSWRVYYLYNISSFITNYCIDSRNFWHRIYWTMASETQTSKEKSSFTG